MSVSEALSVAVGYSLGDQGHSLLFKFQVEQFADHGAGE
jgi:hypothetical protein